MTFVKIKEARGLLGVSARTIANWVDSGILKGHRLPGPYDGQGPRRIERDSIIAFAKKHGIPLPEGFERQ